VHWEPSHPEERLIPLRLRLRFHNGSGLTLKTRCEVVFVQIRVVFLDLETWETNRGISICDNVYLCIVEADAERSRPQHRSFVQLRARPVISSNVIQSYRRVQ
jgi:hypothetical protein